MADNVLFESGDNLDEANLLGAHAKTNQTDYVVRGLGFAVDHTAETLDTGSGAAIIETSNNEAYILETIDARSGLALATTTGTNHVFLSVDDTTDANDVSITVKDADTPPSDPSLKIGTVDASADTSTELNRNPDGDFDSVTTDVSDNVVNHYPGDDLQASIDEAHNSSAVAQSGTVNVVPDTVHSLTNTTFPVTVKEGVTVDMQGAYISPDHDATGLFQPEKEVVFDCAGMHFFEASFTGYVWDLEDTRTAMGNDDGLDILGFPSMNVTDAVPIRIVQKNNGGMAGIYAELNTQGAPEAVRLSGGDAAGFINNNTFIISGAVGSSSGDHFINMFGSGTMRSNRVYFPNLQVKSGTNQVVNYNVGASGLKYNWVGGYIADPQNAASLAKWASGNGPFNQVFIGPGYYQASWTVNNNAGSQPGNGVFALDFPDPNAADLTSFSPTNNARFQLKHDGTGDLGATINCRWDGGNWKLTEPASFTYTGDGTTARTLAEDFQFEQVIIADSGGTVVDAYAGGLSNGALSGSSFSGELTVESSGGFTVGDNSADADPNTDTETYQVYVS